MGAEKRCEGTTWKASPAKMYSRARSTPASKASRLRLLVTGPRAGSSSRSGGRGTGPERRARISATVATVRQ